MGSPPRSLQSHRVRRRLSVISNSLRRAALLSKAEPSVFRLMLVWVVLVAGTGALTLNLFRIQIHQGASLSKKAQEQQTIYVRPSVPRRQVLDRVGTILAIDRPVFTLYAHPKLFKEPKEAIAEKLSPLLKISPADLYKKLNQGETGVRVENSVSEYLSERINQLRLDGLELIQAQQRFYPQQEVAADVVGYVNDDHKGQAGIELSQQGLLERHAKDVTLRRTGDGSILPDQVPPGFLNIDDYQLRLTIDTRLHRAAQAALRQQIKAFNAKRGTVIVMDVRDGSLLALVSEPSYDPNQYFKYPFERFKNWAVADLYEPGSTFKPLNVAIGLETKSVQPSSVFNDEGRITISGWPIEDFDYSSVGGRGPISIGDILKYSSNVGMVHIIQQMKPSLYYGWLRRLGLGEITGIDLPSEVHSQLKDRKTFVGSRIEPATTAFGQGFSLTPIQLAQFHSVLANGGRLVTPHVVKGLFDSKGQLYWQPNFSTPRQIFSKTTTQTVLNMMEKVVKEGTGKGAQIQGYRIGGKTGTAQKANPNGGYYENAKITSFVGVFPLDAPRYVVVSVVDEPQGGDAFGSTVAAPIVKTMIESLITLDKIPPSGTFVPTPATSPDEEEGH